MISSILRGVTQILCPSELTFDFLFWQAVQALSMFGIPLRGDLGDLCGRFGTLFWRPFPLVDAMSESIVATF
jgi:hypothetical protein